MAIYLNAVKTPKIFEIERQKGLFSEVCQYRKPAMLSLDDSTAGLTWSVLTQGFLCHGAFCGVGCLCNPLQKN